MTESSNNFQAVIMNFMLSFMLQEHSSIQSPIIRVCHVVLLVDAFGIDVSDIYLVHDELDKVLGKCVIKEGGSARYVQTMDTSSIFFFCSGFSHHVWSPV